jgi:hypothetical protein
VTAMGYAFSYYGADAIPDDPSPRQRIGIPGRKLEVASPDQIGAIVKVIGGRLKLIYKVEDLSPIPDRLEDLVRRVA